MIKRVKRKLNPLFLGVRQRMFCHYCLSLKSKLLFIKRNIHALSEEELIARCIQDDSECQRLLFNRCASAMLGVCSRYAGNKEEANDMLQEGFILVFNQLGKFRYESSLKTWMTRIMMNASINYLRKYHKIKWEYPQGDWDERNDLTVEIPESYDFRVIMECIQKLPIGYRIVLNMHAIEGLSHKQIAEALKIKEATSRSQYFKAKSALGKLLNQSGINYHQHGVR